MSTQHAPTPTGDNSVNQQLTVKRPRHCSLCGRAKPRPKRQIETPEYADSVERMITRYADRVGSGEVDELGRMLALHGVLEYALQRAVDGLRNGEPSYSWAEIGRRADMSKQAAQQRWGKETDK